MIWSAISSVFSGLIGPLFTYLNKKEDVSLEKFKVNGQVDQSLLQAHVESLKARRDVLLQAMQYRGVRMVQYFFVYPLCFWWSAVIMYCILKPYFPELQPVLALPNPLNDWAAGIIGFYFLTSKVDQWVRKT